MAAVHGQIRNCNTLALITYLDEFVMARSPDEEEQYRLLDRFNVLSMARTLEFTLCVPTPCRDHLAKYRSRLADAVADIASGKQYVVGVPDASTLISLPSAE